MDLMQALERVTSAIKSWVDDHMAAKADVPKLTSITVPTANWGGSENLYNQVVVCNGVTINSKVDLQPTPEQIVELQDAEIALIATNTDGVVTIWAIGGKPAIDMTIQALISEVSIV